MKFILGCQNPLGLESGVIRDESMTALPEAVQSGKEGYYARLNFEEAWCTPAGSGSTDVFTEKNYLEINFHTQMKISAIALQGWTQYSYGNYIRISYDLGGGMWLNYKKANKEKDV